MYQRIEPSLHRLGPSSFDGSTKSRILAEAARAFAEDGYDRVTIRRIALAARVNVAAVNYHFGSKAGLYRVAVESALWRLRDTLSASQLLPHTLPEAAQALTAAFLGAPEDDQRAILVRLIAWELVRTPADLSAGDPSAVDVLTQHLSDRLPSAGSQEDRAIIVNWIVGQCLMFALPPLSGIENSRNRLAALMAGGLSGVADTPRDSNG